MKVVNFWKTLFCAALAVTAFSACSDDDEEGGYSGMPEITVNGGESVTVAGKLEGGKLEQTVEVVSKGDWTLTFKNSGDSQWVTPSAMSGFGRAQRNPCSDRQLHGRGLPAYGRGYDHGRTERQRCSDG